MKYANSLFKKISNYIEEKECNDFHCIPLVMVSCAWQGRLMVLQKNENIIESYFQCNPEVYDFIEQYNALKLMKFLERIFRTNNLILKNKLS